MPNYEDQITPPEQTGSAISKGLGQMALTMAMFVGGSALASVGLRKGTTALLTRLSQHKSQLKKAAEYGLKNNASLTAFLSKTNTGVQPLASYLHKAASSSTAINAQSTLNNVQGMSGKLDKYRSFSKGQKGALMRKWGSAYFKETAFLAPTFYVMEQNLGVLGEGPEHKQGPAWWNLPGHAVNFAKYLPIYIGADAVFRGGGKFVKAGFGTIANKIVDHVPQVVQDSLAKTASSLNRGDYLNTKVGGLPLKTFTAGMGAASEAFQHALGSGRRKLFTQTNKTMSRYKRTGESMSSIYKFAKKAFAEKYDYSYKNILNQYKKRQERGRTDSKENFENSFDDFLQFMGTRAGTNQYVNTVGGANYAAGGKSFVQKAFYNESGKLSYKARLLGLRRAKASDFSKDVRKKVIGKVYTDIKAMPTGAKGKILAEKNKTDFIDNVLARDMYFNERTKSLIDIKKMGATYWTDKMLHSKLLVLGNKFSMADLFPMKAISRKEMHRVMPVNELMAIAPSSQTAAFQKGRWSQMGQGKALNHTNIYNFKRTPGLLMRETGEKNYKLFDVQEGKWEQIGHSLKAALVADSPKLANVYIQGQMRGTGNLTDNKGTSDNPFFSFMQNQLGMFDGKGSAPSIFSRLQTFLPDKFNHMIDGKHTRHSAYNARNTIGELKQWMGAELGQTGANKVEKETLNSLMLRVNSLSSKMSKRSFDDVLSDDYYMTEVLDFLNHQGVIKELGLSSGKILSDESSMLKVAELIRKKPETGFFGETKAVGNILDAVKLGGRGLEDRGGIESPTKKIKRYIYEYSVFHSNRQKLDNGKGIVDLLQTKVKKSLGEGRIGSKQASQIEFGMFHDQLRMDMKNFTTSTIVDPDNLAAYANQHIIDELKSHSDRYSHFLKKANNYLTKDSISGPGSILDEFTEQLGMMETTWAMNTGIEINDLVASANMVKNANPFIALPTDIKSVAEVGLGWGFNTINKLISHAGLGWDQGKYNTSGAVANLWGKRLGAFAGATVAYTAADTFVDTSGLFDWSFLDEGITVGVADQMVKARMTSGWVYDKMGIDNAARYMEGLMPGSSKTIPGAALGFAMGGVRGGVIGGLANAYLQPQLAEGPLSFLGAVTPLAPFVQDLTKDYGELQDLYSGKDMVPVRKGRGWTLGITPISGGRIERYEPGWYPRLKAQSQAGPVLYGSKLEQFLTRDVPFVDFSLMDIVDPHYLEKKQWEDRPYPIPSTVFSEMPVIGPLAGATVGRLYNSLHPMALGNQSHNDTAQRAYMKGTGTNWRGESTGTFGPQYSGYLGNFATGSGFLAGQGPQKAAIMSPHNIKPLIGEQVYKGWIEPMGLPGFITSASLWGGDEPYTHIPIAESADKMDSLARRYWDAGLGDLAGTTELLRRAVPRPRTSIETVNFLGNKMPSWMPSQFQEGDPYCLTPETLVETEGALMRADEIKEGTLVKTLHGRYFPVEAVKSREVDEKIFIITIDGIEDFPISVTGGHPFYINDEWVFAKDLTCQDKVTYPLLDIDLPKQITINNESIPLNGVSMHLAGLLSRWALIEDNELSYRIETPSDIITEIEYYLDQFIQDPNYYVELVEVLQNDGMHAHLLSGSLADLINYLKSFLVKSETNENRAVFRFHNKNAAYKAWTSLLHHKIPGRVVENMLVVSGTALVELGYYLDINVKGFGPSEIVIQSDSAIQTAKRGPCVYLHIKDIKCKPYKGLVYALDVGEEETFTVPGAVVHNSKIANGELLLPGDSYENFFKPSIVFPSGASRLGYTPYEQALTMVGLGDFSLETEEIFEQGSAIHEMVQNQLIQTGLASRVEALISDSELDLRSYVDAMYKDPRTQQELPLEIKSIGGTGLNRLSSPKWKHRVQINSYMAMMGVTQGKFLYVSRDNPEETKEFGVRFDPNLWEKTKSDLLEARRLATEFLEQGYGDASAGYSYIDRMQVLLNANPYSKEYRESEKLVQQKFDQGYLNTSEEEQFSKLQGQHKAMMMKYQMYPHRFKVSQLLNPDAEYQNLSQNDDIKPASDYSIVERIIGSFWEYGTHLRSPIHTKVLGHYSPEEQYENMMLRGDFASWTSPIEGFAKPYARGLRATRDPLQGGVSWGIGGALLGGGPGAMFGAAIGATYGTLHGAYRAATGSHYTPDSFRERQEYQEYFDMIEYQRAQQMYESTGNQRYRKEILSNFGGWMNTGGGQGYNLEYENSSIGYNVGSSPQSRVLKHLHNPAAMGLGSDRGFGSPWQGSDPSIALGFETDVNIYNAFSAMPTWDRPFWTAFLEAPESNRERILKIADSQMGDMLKMAWGRGEEVSMPNPDVFFSTYNKPSSLHPLMSPNVDIGDYQTATVLNEGMEAHDFGMGWRDQMLRIKNNPLIQPIDINGISSEIGAMNLSQAEVTDAVRQILDRMGYVGSTVNVRIVPVDNDETSVVLNVRRTYAAEIVKQVYGSE